MKNNQRLKLLALYLCIFIGCFGCYSESKSIRLIYGKSQQFRYRHNDINILGNFAGTAKEAIYQLNDGETAAFYVKGSDRKKDKISRNRLFRDGDFNIEIPAT